MVARIVYVIFLEHVVAREFHNVCEGASYRSPSSVTDVERTCRVCAYIFENYFFTVSDIIFAEVGFFAQNIFYRCAENSVF